MSVPPNVDIYTITVPVTPYSNMIWSVSGSEARAYGAAPWKALLATEKNKMTITLGDASVIRDDDSITFEVRSRMQCTVSVDLARPSIESLIARLESPMAALEEENHQLRARVADLEKRVPPPPKRKIEDSVWSGLKGSPFE